MTETSQAAEKAKKTAKETAARAADAWRVPSYEVPEALRAMTEQGIEQARETYARMKAVAEETTDMVEETVETTREGLTALQLRSLDAAKANADAFFDLTRKLLGYALGRGVQLSDEPLLDEMQQQLEKNDYRFFAAVEPILRSRQFREIPGLMEGTAKPDTARCVVIATGGALKEMIVPGLAAVILPPVIGFVLGKEALGGFLAGATLMGVFLALMMANAGGAWDNANKFIEAGNLGGKGSDPHKAAVVGDTVGDPFKDTSGPAMNILIKLMSVVALVLAPLFR